MAYDGFDCILYRGTAGAEAATVMTNVRDVTPDISYTENDVSTRGGGVFKQYALGQGDSTIDVEMIADNSDEDYLAFTTVYQSRGQIAIKCINNTAGVGCGGDMVISKVSEPQPLDGVLVCTFTLRPGYSTANPFDVVALGS